MGSPPPFSLYLHIPFCRHKCSYCDFNTYAGIGELIDPYVDALCKEIQLLANGAGQLLPVHTVFFGGGTPSLLSPGQLERILYHLESGFDLQPDVEITLEANPGTLSQDDLRAAHALGVNRLSLGMQSSHPNDLVLLEREHDFSDVLRGVVWTRRADFSDINLDLIFGLPGQDLERWQRTLSLAVGLQPEHLSLYALSLEHGTPLDHWIGRGLMPAPNPDVAAEMYEWAARELDRRGYHQYEISNWAAADGEGRLKTCRHNLQYWRNLPYLGLGAGAHGFTGEIRTANVLAPRAYIQRCAQGGVKAFPLTPATASATRLDRHTQMKETMLMGLRLTSDGVAEADFYQRFARSIRDEFGQETAELVGLGLLEWANEPHEVLRLTPRGRLLGNQVFRRFV